MTQTALAKELGVTRRTVAEWDLKGLKAAARISEKPVRYDALKAWKWRWQNDKSSPLTAAKLRKLEAEAEQKELEVAVSRGDLLPVVDARRAWEFVLTRIRARIVAMEGSLPPVLVGMDTPREVSAVLGPACRELLDEIRAVAGEIETDAA